MRKELTKKDAVNQGCMSLLSHKLEYGRHLAQLRHCCRCACPPMSNIASHDNHEKINSRVSFALL